MLGNIQGRDPGDDETPSQLLAREIAFFEDKVLYEQEMAMMSAPLREAQQVRHKAERNEACVAVRSLEQLGLSVPDMLYTRA